MKVNIYISKSITITKVMTTFTSNMLAVLCSQSKL